MIDSTVDPFINAYRDSLERQRDLAVQNLDATRRNDFATIMAGANKAGMMYSNFPQRDKIKYDTQTYMPERVKIQQTYQTGLDKLRGNTINLANQLKTINDAIAELNGTIPDNVTKLNNAGDYVVNGDSGRQFYDANDKSIRMGTVAKRLGYTTSDQILGLAKASLSDDEYARLKSIYDLQANTTHPNFVYNVGDTFKPNTSNYLSESDRNFLDSLGLAFGS